MTQIRRTHTGCRDKTTQHVEQPSGGMALGIRTSAIQRLPR